MFKMDAEYLSGLAPCEVKSIVKDYVRVYGEPSDIDMYRARNKIDCGIYDVCDGSLKGIKMAKLFELSISPKVLYKSRNIYPGNVVKIDFKNGEVHHGVVAHVSENGRVYIVMLMKGKNNFSDLGVDITLWDGNSYVVACNHVVYQNSNTVFKVIGNLNEQELNKLLMIFYESIRKCS